MRSSDCAQLQDRHLYIDIDGEVFGKSGFVIKRHPLNLSRKTRYVSPFQPGKLLGYSIGYYLSVAIRSGKSASAVFFNCSHVAVLRKFVNVTTASDFCNLGRRRELRGTVNCSL